MDLAAINRGCSNTSITHLPGDTLYLIYKKLDSNHDRESFCLTCHCFFNILALRRKYLMLGCSHQSNCSSHASVDALLKRYSRLESLSLDGCAKVSNSALTQLRIFGSRLYSLKLSNCPNVGDIGISSIASGCPLLSIIHLSNCSITDSGLEILTKSCKSLEIVDLSWCKNITNRGIWSLNQNCHRVRTLNVCGSAKVVGLADLNGNPGPSTGHSTFVDRKQYHCIALEQLSGRRPFRAFDSRGVAGILSGGGLQYLTHLNFERCYFVEDDAVMTISKGCPLLLEWNLAFCYKIGIFGWESIGLYAENLEILNVSYCDNLCSRGLTALDNGCKRLSVLYINKCLNIGGRIHGFKNKNVHVQIIQEVSSTIVPTWAFCY